MKKFNEFDILRTNLKITQRQIAHWLDVSHLTYFNWVHGRTIPADGNADKIEKFQPLLKQILDFRDYHESRK